MDQRIIDLYDDYTHRPLPRRAFLERLGTLAGSAAAAEAALVLLECDYARADIVPEAAGRVETRNFEVEGGKIKGYAAFPKGMKPETATHAVIVIHENRGLNPHIKDVARHVATEGLFAFAPDFLSALGGTPDNEDAAREAFAKLNFADAVEMARTIVAGFKSRNPAMKVGAMGFCWGGGMVNAMAEVAPGLDAGVAYYGVAPPLDKVKDIKTRMMMHYGALDQRVNATRAPYEEALKAAGVAYEMFVYEGANHAFNNDASAERYNEAAAKLAWSRTIGLLKQALAV